MTHEFEQFEKHFQEMDVFACIDHTSIISRSLSTIHDPVTKRIAITALNKIIDWFPYRKDADAAIAIREQLQIIKSALKSGGHDWSSTK